MNYSLYAPPHHLKDLVKCFWTLETEPNELAPKEYFLMADASTELIFQFRGGVKKFASLKAYVRPQHTKNEKLALEDQLGLFGIRLFPHALQHLAKIPSSELVNSVVGFEALFKQPGKDLSDQIIEANSVYDRLASAIAFLTRMDAEQNTNPFIQLVKQTLANDGKIDLPQLHRQANLSVKQFERRFTAIAGFTPKYYARVARFQSTKRKYVSGNYKTLAELAHACGYYDQSHFIRDFKEFSGMQAHHYFNLLDKGDSEARAIKELILAKDQAV
ncbi:MAG: helix-turn-helix domain-containing protein [Chryseolinea sp.]